LQKWSKGKQKEKVNNMVLFDQATYDKLLVEVPKYKLITPSVLSDRLRVSSSHKMLLYWIMLVLPNCLCSCIRDSRKTLYKMNLLWAECFSCSIDPFFCARLCCNLRWVVNTMSLKTSTFSNKTLRSGKRGVPYVFVSYFVWLPAKKLFWRIEKGLCCLSLKKNSWSTFFKCHYFTVLLYGASNWLCPDKATTLLHRPRYYRFLHYDYCPRTQIWAVQV
jgi:hypothetical protein